MELYKDMKIKKRARLKMFRNIIFFLVLIIFTFWFILKDQDLNELKNSLIMADKRYVFIGFLFMFLTYLMETVNIRNVLHSLGEKRMSIIRAFKYTAIGNFFSAITPGASGGQPVEIYYMSKDDIKTTSGTLALLIQLCAFQICTIFLALLCGFVYRSLLTGSMLWFYLLGIVTNTIVLIGMLIGMFSNKLTTKFIKLVLKAMKKAKLKNYEIRKQKLEEGLKQYIEGAKFIRDNKKVFIEGIIIVFVQIIFYYSIPYFIYRSFGLNEYSYFELFSIEAILFKTVSAIPIPGSVGVSETLFLKLYGPAFGKALLNGAMLLFRFVSFYIYIFIFAFVVFINGTKTKNKDSKIDIDVKEIEGE